VDINYYHLGRNLVLSSSPLCLTMQPAALAAARSVMAANPAPSRVLTLHTRTEPDAVVVECRGRLVREAGDQLRQTVKPLIPQTKRLVLDLTELAHMDSSGLGVLVGLYVSARSAGCQLQLINLNQRIRQLLGMTHLLSAFEACGKYMIKMP
jgi:anti-sigma B factor antagonist